MKLPHLRSEQIKNQPDQTAALINRLVDEVEKKGDGGGGGGTNDFDQLINRPSYNGTTMTGNTNIPAVPTKTSQLNNDSGFVNNTDLTNAISNHNTSGTAHSDIRNSITSLSNSVTAIQNVIPTAATVNNKLTDKNYVDDSINSVTAYYITKNAAGDAFATKAELNSATTFYSGGQVRIPTRNDYCIVEADESKRDPITGEDPTTRYIYNNGWEFQYIVNKTALTADQLAALNSGVTAADVTKLSGIEAGAEVNVQADWTEADNTSDAYIKNKPTIGDATLTITQNGTSVGTFTANATSDVTLALTDTLYNDFTGATNITAGAHGLVIAPAAGDEMKALYGDGTWKLAHMTIAAYGKSTYAEILAAYKANNIIYCRASSNSNPGSGNQLRMAFLAYVNNEATPTEFEFQYYRSVATHTDSQQGDQVYVYKINSAGTWSVTVRSAFTKVAAGTNMSSSYSSGTITLNATDTTYSDFVGATSGTAGAHGLVPAPTTSDPDKFLKGDGTWDTPTDTTYSDFTGATSGTAGTSGLVPGPLAGDQDKYLKGDGTWGTISSNDTVYYINNPLEDLTTFSIYTDNTLTTAVSAQTLHTAFTSGRVILRADVSGYRNSAYELVDALYDVDDAAYDFFLIQGTTEYTFGGSANTTSFTMNEKSLQQRLTAGSNIQINGTTISATDTTYSAFTGATSGAAGTSGLVPQPAAGDQDKYLKADGTWATVQAGGTMTTFYWSSANSAMYKDSGLTTAATISDIETAASAGPVKIYLANFGRYEYLVSDEISNGDYFSTVWAAANGNLRSVTYTYSSNTWSRTSANVQKELTAGTNISISGNTISATDTTYSDFTGASSGTAGVTGLVPAPAAGDNTKFLSGDGTWKTVSAGGTRTEFCWGSSPDNTMKDSTDTNTVTGQDVYDACELGQVIIKSRNPKPDHYDEVVSYQYYQSIYRFVVTYKDYSDSKHDMREYVYESGSWSSNTITLQNELSNATTATDGTMSAADKTNLDNLVTDDYLHDKFIAKGGTEIPNNSDLNTTAFLDLGMYFKGRNVDVQTLVNCPTRNAFTMRVYSPNDDFVRNTMTATWVYRLREITTILGERYLQRASSGDTAGTFTYSTWKRVLTTDDGSFADKVDIASENLDDYSGTLAAKVQSIYPAGYHRWYTTINGSVANITDKPTSGNVGFVLEAFLERDNNSTDWAYKVVCYTSYDDNKNYVGYVRNNTTSITWERLITSSEIKSSTTQSDAGWSADKNKIPDMSFMAYWNGAYSGTSSNLQYFKNNSVTTANIQDGAITTAKLNDFNTANTADTWVPVANSGKIQHRVIKAFNADGSVPISALDTYSSGHCWSKVPIVNASGVTEVGKYIDFHNTDGSTNNYDVRLTINSAGATTVTIPNKTGTMALTSDCNYTAGTYDLGGIDLIGNTGNTTNKATWTLPLNKGTAGVTVSSVKLSEASTSYWGFTIPGHVSCRASTGNATNIAIKGGCLIFTTGLNATVSTYNMVAQHFGKIEVTFTAS